MTLCWYAFTHLTRSAAEQKHNFNILDAVQSCGPCAGHLKMQHNHVDHVQDTFRSSTSVWTISRTPSGEVQAKAPSRVQSSTNHAASSTLKHQTLQSSKLNAIKHPSPHVMCLIFKQEGHFRSGRKRRRKRRRRRRPARPLAGLWRESIVCPAIRGKLYMGK